MRYLFIGLLLAVMAVGAIAAQFSPLPQASVPPTAAATPFCVAANPASSVGYFVQTSVINANASAVTLSDGTNTYVATLGPGGSVSCFLKQ